MEGTLQGKVAVVTGASSGIGEATARELASRGAAVALLARSEPKVRFLERELRAAGAEALAIPTDVSDDRSVAAAFEEVAAWRGAVDVLVNNAGLGLSGRVAELRPDDLRGVFEVNVIGALRCTQAAFTLMPRGGRVINVSSVVGLRAIPNVGGYSATKFALNALSDALRVEVAKRGITVTSVYPGTTRTAFRDNARRTGNEERGWRPRGVAPEKVAEKIAGAAEAGGRDVYVTLKDRLFVLGTRAFPGLTDRVLSRWARG